MLAASSAHAVPALLGRTLTLGDWLETKWIHRFNVCKIIKHDTHKIQMLLSQLARLGPLDSKVF